MKQLKQNDGFTLVELVIAMATGVLIFSAAATLLLLGLRINNLTTGTIITTSGLSGIFPRGLVLGYVTQVAASEYDASYYALVQPYADIRSVTDVFVITSFEGQGQAAENLFTDEPVSSLPAENGTASSGDDSGSSENGGQGE